MVEAAMGDVRSLLHHPSLENWQALCEMFESWTDERELVEQLIPYSARLLEAWPAELERPSAPRWMAVFTGDRPSPRHLALLTLATVWLQDDCHTSEPQLESWPAMSHVVRRIWYNGKLQGPTAHWLRECTMPQLDTLMLGSWRYYDTLQVIEASWFEQLRALELRDVKFKALMQLMERHSFAQLESLSIALQALGKKVSASRALRGDKLETLLGLPFVSQLKELSLRHCGIDSEGASRLANAPQLGQLRSLDLSYNGALDEDDRATLEASPYLPPVLKIRLLDDSDDEDLDDYDEDYE